MKKNKTTTYMFVVAIISMFLIFASDKIVFVLSIFRPLFFGVIIAYLLDCMVRLVLRCPKMKRWVAVTIVLVFALLVCGVTVYKVIPFMGRTIKELIDYVTLLLSQHDTAIYEYADEISKYFNIDLDVLWDFDFSKIDKNLIDTAKKALQGIYGFTVGTVSKMGSGIIVAFTSIILSVYMLLEKNDLINRMKRFVRAVGSEKNEKYILSSFAMANDVFKSFVIGKAVDSFIIGLLIIVANVIFGIEYGVVFGLLCGIGNMIPYFGPILTAVPIVLVLLIINPVHALIALIIILVAQQLDSYIVQPKILGDNLGGVSPFWILFGVTICGTAFGFLGMIFGVPVVVIIKNLVEDFVERRLTEREPKLTAEEGEVKNAQEQKSEA